MLYLILFQQYFWIIFFNFKIYKVPPLALLSPIPCPTECQRFLHQLCNFVYPHRYRIHLQFPLKCHWNFTYKNVFSAAPNKTHEKIKIESSGKTEPLNYYWVLCIVARDVVDGWVGGCGKTLAHENSIAKRILHFNCTWKWKWSEVRGFGVGFEGEYSLKCWKIQAS